MFERNGVVEADEVEHELLVLLGVAHVDDGVLRKKDRSFQSCNQNYVSFNKQDSFLMNNYQFEVTEV